MTTLTETAFYTRKAVRYGILALFIFLIVDILWAVGVNYWKAANPPPPPPPTVGFGKLPSLKFPQRSDLPGLTYKLETIDGMTPDIGLDSKVYPVPKPVANLLALDRAKEIANRLGFQSEPQAISDKIFRFTGENGNSILEMDIINQSFKLNYDYVNDQSILLEKKLPDDNQAITEAKAFLHQAGLPTGELDSGRTKITYWRLVAPNLVPAISLSEADFVRVDLFRNDLDKRQVMPKNPIEAPVYFIFSGSRGLNKRVVEMNYTHRPAQIENPATYPLKSSTAAWKELSEGKQGFVAQLGQNPQGQITIRKVYLAYYEADENTQFIQPIVVFEGDNNFLAYVPAIDPKWTE